MTREKPHWLVWLVARVYVWGWAVAEKKGISHHFPTIRQMIGEANMGEDLVRSIEATIAELRQGKNQPG